MGSSKNAVDLLRFENRKRKRKKRKMCITYKKFCGCCCNIVQAAKILAVLELIFGALALMVALAFFPYLDKYFKGDYDDQNYEHLPNIVSIITTIIVEALFIITTALKLYGLKKRRPGYILPWLIFNMICLVLSIIATVCILVFCGIYTNDLKYYAREPIGVVFIAATYGLAFAFFFNIWDVVKSAYKQIKEENESNQLAYPNQMPMKTTFQQTPPKYNNQVVYTVQPI